MAKVIFTMKAMGATLMMAFGFFNAVRSLGADYPFGFKAMFALIFAIIGMVGVALYRESREEYRTDKGQKA